MARNLRQVKAQTVLMEFTLVKDSARAGFCFAIREQTFARVVPRLWAKNDEYARILKYLGEALRADIRGFTDAPPPRPILLQVLHLIRREQERHGADASPLSWKELPEELQRLLEQLKMRKARSVGHLKRLVLIRER